jgi:YD repeat-containing protein
MAAIRGSKVLNRLSAASSLDAQTSGSRGSTCTYNSANHRTRRTDADSSHWSYQYDSLGQVTSGKRVWQDGTPVAGQQFEYAFDDIGNRK